MDIVNVALFLTAWVLGSIPLALIIGRIASSGDEESDADELAMVREIDRRRQVRTREQVRA
jgi:hypothetical protein